MRTQITHEAIQAAFPDLDDELQEAVFTVANMYPEIPSFPSSRLSYEVHVWIKDNTDCKISEVWKRAMVATNAIKRLIPTHNSKSEAHPVGSEAFKDGEELGSNPFPPKKFPDAHREWEQSWLETQSRW